MSRVSVDQVVSDVVGLFPCPGDEFEGCEWCQVMVEAFERLVLFFAGEHHRLVGEIESRNLTSDQFVLVREERAERRVEVGALREGLPEVFSEVVHVRATDAERFIGRRRLYELSVECAGRERVLPFELVSVRDLERVLPGSEVERFVRVVRREGRVEVRRVGS